MSKKEIKRNSKLNKIISRLSDIKFDTIITESGLVIPLQEEAQEAPKKTYYPLASALVLFIPIAGLIISPILAFAGYKRGERGSLALLVINAVVWALVLFVFLLSYLLTKPG